MVNRVQSLMGGSQPPWFASEFSFGLFFGVIGDHGWGHTIALEYKGQGLTGVPFALHRASMCQPKGVAYAWAILLPCREMDPANNLSLNMVCNTRLYQSIWSLVGNCRERVGLRHVRTPLCVIITTVRFARSGEIIQQMAKVWGSMGVVLRNQTCPLRLVSMLDI
jgi:hypothetical protein